MMRGGRDAGARAEGRSGGRHQSALLSLGAAQARLGHVKVPHLPCTPSPCPAVLQQGRVA